MASKPAIKTIYRSSVTGRIIKASYAKAHPRITEKQHVYVPSPKKGR
jgi:hypothetical protein